MEPIKKLELLKKLSVDLVNGKFNSLFPYLELKKAEEIQNAQQYALNSEHERASASILISSVYDMLLSFESEDNSVLLSELKSIEEELANKDNDASENY